MFSDDKMVGSNLKEIASVRGWIDDFVSFNDTFNKYAPLEDARNKSMVETSKVKGKKKGVESLNTTQKNIEN